jgi:haloalkane dehalogenase
MDILRTPDDRFLDLPDFPFLPHYIDLDGIRMHYLDEGKGPLILLLHGEPSWSFLYRKMIPVLVSSGFRIVAPDLIGFGKSDKLTDPDAYTYQTHMDWLTSFLKKLDLTDITLFCQDWGGLLGLRLAAENESRFKQICAGNTFLPTGDNPPKQAFLDWKNFSQNVSKLPVGKIIQGACVSKLSSQELAAYNAPYPSEEYKVAARKFPLLVPITPNDPASEANRKAWETLKQWKKPFLCLFSDSDPVTKGGDVFFRRLIPGSKGQPHETIAQAGHFLQEDKGPQIAEKLAAWAKIS